MISIIIPVYRVEKFLQRCLDSILAQEYADWECILVDDGSPDNSCHICDEYVEKDSRFTAIHKVNGGVSSARNAGIEIAKGEWISFVDSDDYVSPDWLSSLNKYIHHYKNADCFVWGHYVNRNESKKFKPIIPSGNVYTSNYDFLISSDYKHVSCCFLFQHATVSNNNCAFPTGIRTGEDQCFILESLAHTHFIVTIPEAYYYYVDNPNSAVNNLTSLADTEDALKVALRFSKYCREENVEQNEYKRKAITSLFYIYLYQICVRHYSFSTTAQKTYRYYYKQILKVQPSLRFDFKLKIAYISVVIYSFYLLGARLKSALFKNI